MKRNKEGNIKPVRWRSDDQETPGWRIMEKNRKGSSSEKESVCTKERGKETSWTRNEIEIC